MDEKKVESRIRFPKWSLVWTIFAAIVIAVLYIFGEQINEKYDWQPGLMNLLKVLMVFITFMVWMFWLTFFSGHRFRYLISLVVLSLVGLFFYRFRIVFDGDLEFVRIESRFVERTFDVVRKTVGEEKSVAGVDLTKTASSDFYQFLGNQRDGIVRGRTLNPDWTASPPEVIWKKSVGEGWSGFSAVNGYAITQEQRGQDECVTCYEIETGELKWVYAAARRHEDTMSLGRAGPRATPTIHNGKVYVQGATGFLDCLDGSNGELIWSVDIADLLGVDMMSKTSTRGYQYEYEDDSKSTLAWGRSGSPLIYKDSVIATGGVRNDGKCDTLIAFDKNNGTELWRGGDKMIAYGSPAIANLMGSVQLTLVAEDTAMGFDPENGRVLWETFREGASNANANCSQVTRIADDKVLLTKAYSLGGELVRLIEDGENFKTELIWKDPRVLKTKMMSPVVLGEYAYCLSDGFLECTLISEDTDARKRVWRKRGRFGNGQLLLVGKYLLVHTEYGQLKLVEATPDKYNELGEIDTVDGVCWNTICLYKNYLLVRSELEAACIRLDVEFETAEKAPNELPESAADAANESDPDNAKTALGSDADDEDSQNQ